MFRWEKLGRIYNPYDFEDRPIWMHEYALAPCTLVFDSFVRVYFGSRPPKGPDGMSTTYQSYVDLDRKNLLKIIRIAKEPVIKLGNLGYFDEFGTYPLSVVREDNGILGFYAGWTRCESTPFNTGIGMVNSWDGGETFKKIEGKGPVIPYTQDEPFTISGPKIRKFNGLYYMFYIAGKEWLIKNGKPEICHKIRTAVSSDGKKWTKRNRDIIPNYWDENESQASPDVFYLNGKYHMFFDGWVPSTFRETGKRLIGYAYSDDLLNWTRDDSQAGIAPSEDITFWDCKMVAYPHVFELDGDYYMLYIGNEVGRYGFGIAKLV